jgi:putative spermidine/putrescine transport system ATP-binding protein
MSVRLEVRALTRRYGAVTAVDGVSHAFARGRITTIVGPSGSGKTTTLSLVAGLVEPDAGTVLLDGRDVTRWPAERRGFGVVFQSYALFPHLSAAENVEFGLRVRGVRRAERRRRAAEALERVRIGALGDRRIHQLSGGEQQRVALARAIVFEPAVLLLDEPLSALDAKLREHIRLELRQLLRDLGITTIVVTHDQVEALCLGDEVVILRAGRIEQAGPPHEVYANPASPFVATFLGSANVLDAEVVHASGGARLRLPFGELAAPTSRPAGPCRVVIRPEDIAVDGPSGAGVPAEITSAAFLGQHVRLGLVAGGCALAALARNDVLPAVGAAVTVRVDERKLRLLPQLPEPA